MSQDEQRDGGFEYQGDHYRLNFSELGKDLMLVDRITNGMSLTDFYDALGDDEKRGRGPVLLALVATSIRHGHPDWSVERIVRTVENLNLSDLVWTTDDTEEPAAPLASKSDGSEKSPSNGSLALLTPADSSTSETWSEIPV